MISRLAHSMSNVELIALQTLLILLIGLMASLVLRKRPVRAHAAILLAIVGCFAVPLLTSAVHISGWGLLPSPSLDLSESGSRARGTDPLTAEPTNATTRLPTESTQLAAPALATAGGASQVLPTRPIPEPKTSLATPAPGGLAPRTAAYAAWMLASVLLLARLLIRVARDRALLAAAQPIDDQRTRSQLDQATKRIGLSVVAAPYTSDAVRSPVVWCWGARPVLLLPRERARDDAVSWRDVFTHELAHWKRRDHLSSVAAELLVCLLPWNPLAWIARRRLKYLAERSCDECALSGGALATRYASSLLALLPPSRSSIALAAVGSRPSLVRRVEAILAFEHAAPHTGRLWSAGILALGLGVVILASLAQPGASKVRAQELPVRGTTANDPAAPGDWDTRLAALDPYNSRGAFALGNELASLAPDEGFAILERNWKTLPVSVRQQMLKAWSFARPYPLVPRGHPRLLDALHLGMTDASPKVQTWAIGYLRRTVFRDFAENIEVYRGWYERTRDRTLLEVMTEECDAFVRRLAEVSRDDRSALAEMLADVRYTFRNVPELRKTAKQAGILDVLERWLADAPGRDELRAAFVLRYLDPDVEYLRRVVLATCRRGRSFEVRAEALSILGHESNGWAVESLRKMLVQTLEDEQEFDVASAIARALGDIGDPRVIPTMIGIIAADNQYQTVYGVGYFGLGDLTGVRYDKSHDGEWWRDWWERNKTRYPEDVQRLQIPKLEKKFSSSKGGAGSSAAEDVADVSAQDLRIGDDANKRYFLIGANSDAKPPAEGYRLIVLLPGGDGSADFHAFCKRIQKNALSAEYLVAQAVAPRWSDDKDRITWPRKTLPDPNMKFTTDHFLAAIVKDVRSRHKIDPRYIFLLGWSSGGPACYAATLDKSLPFTGAFVAMSVFKPDTLPPLDGAKRKAYYILHSPQDFIGMRFPEAAAKQLAEHGAKTKVQTYEGGHGWRGDVYGNIRSGIRWLENALEPN